MLNTQRLLLLAWDNLGVGIIVDGLPEYLSVRETVATAFLHIVQNVGHALVHVLGRVAVLLCK